MEQYKQEFIEFMVESPPLQVGEDVTFFMRNPVSGLEKQRRLW